jgi:hypothetical protein
MKKVGIATIVLLASFGTIEILLRTIGIAPAHEIEYQYEVRIRPNHFFAPDSLLVWQSAAGTFSFSYNDTIPLFNCTILPNHQRIATASPTGAIAQHQFIFTVAVLPSAIPYKTTKQ